MQTNRAETYANSGPVQEVSRIDRSMAGTQRSLEMLHESITALESKLSSILGPSQGGTAANGEPKQPVQLADRICLHERGADVARERINSILTRLEL